MVTARASLRHGRTTSSSGEEGVVGVRGEEVVVAPG
jgi:hypothetical protein